MLRTPVEITSLSVTLRSRAYPLGRRDTSGPRPDIPGTTVDEVLLVVSRAHVLSHGITVTSQVFARTPVFKISPRSLITAGCVRVNSVLESEAVEIAQALGVIGRAERSVESATILFHALILTHIQIVH